MLGLSCEDLKEREIAGKKIGAGKPFRGSLLCMLPRGSRLFNNVNNLHYLYTSTEYMI